MPSIRQFRTALAAAQFGSFVAAGRHVGLTQAAVSLQIKNLESELDTQLFERRAQAAVPTPHGRQILAELEDLVARYEQLLAQSGDTLRGSLRIGTLVSSLMGTFGTVLARIKRDYPALHITLLAGQSADFAARVAGGELDAAVVTEPPHGVEPALIWTPLYQEPLVLIAAARLRRKSVASLLATEPFLQFDRSLWTGHLITEALASQGATPNTILELNSIEAIAELVRQDYGVAVVPLLANADWRASKQLAVKPLPGPGPVIMRRVGMLERRRHGKLAITRTLRGVFAQNAG
ncbi:MAG TPA: LysR family transcriptional regulator [Bordetella sp.]|nr:LysR family transcriptional regulator [Bordetella sp.]